MGGGLRQRSPVDRESSSKAGWTMDYTFVFHRLCERFSSAWFSCTAQDYVHSSFPARRWNQMSRMRDVFAIG